MEPGHDDAVTLLRGEPLARYSTFHAGGPADVLPVESGAELEALARAGQLPELQLVLGGGSNVLVADEGVDGTVLVLRATAPAPLSEPDGDGVVWVDGAAEWPALALSCAEAGLQGLESMVGIPGTVGGAVVQGIGAYGYELRERFVAAAGVELSTGNVVELGPADVGFRYRHTELKVQQPPRVVITRVGLRLSPGGRHQPRYAELSRILAETCGESTNGYQPAVVAAAVLGLRRGKSMVYDPADSQTWGAGSFFKNPETDDTGFTRLVERLGIDATTTPHWETGEHRIRLSAGWLVEQSGFRKGHRAGDVALCDHHALGIVNVSGRASARQIAGFAGDIRQAVWAHAGVALEPEPVLIGLELPPIST